MDKQKQQEAYRDYVKWKTPVHNLPLNMAKAFDRRDDLSAGTDDLEQM